MVHLQTQVYCSNFQCVGQNLLEDNFSQSTFYGTGVFHFSQHRNIIYRSLYILVAAVGTEGLISTQAIRSRMSYTLLRVQIVITYSLMYSLLGKMYVQTLSASSITPHKYAQLSTRKTVATLDICTTNSIITFFDVINLAVWLKLMTVINLKQPFQQKYLSNYMHNQKLPKWFSTWSTSQFLTCTLTFPSSSLTWYWKWNARLTPIRMKTKHM